MQTMQTKFPQNQTLAVDVTVTNSSPRDDNSANIFEHTALSQLQSVIDVIDKNEAQLYRDLVDPGSKVILNDIFTRLRSLVPQWIKVNPPINALFGVPCGIFIVDDDMFITLILITKWKGKRVILLKKNFGGKKDEESWTCLSFRTLFRANPAKKPNKKNVSRRWRRFIGILWQRTRDSSRCF